MIDLLPFMLLNEQYIKKLSRIYVLSFRKNNLIQLAKVIPL